jgi:hypothetical protein
MSSGRERVSSCTILLYGDLVANAQGHISFWYGVAMRTRTAKNAESLQRVPFGVLVRFSDETSLL